MECDLCTETCTFFCITVCGHKSICTLCWYRLRSILYKNSCPVCRQECKHVFVTANPSLTYEDIYKTMWGDSFTGFKHDDLSHMDFDDISELQRLQNFRKSICKICRLESKNFKHFKNHLLTFHNLRICDQCSQNNKLFPSEQELYTEDDYKIHKITLHVQCDLCFTYYYDQRELLLHIKSSHFFCELCAVEKRTAFSHYEDLESHYRQAHYLCEIEMCKNEMHVVFMTYDDLKDHYRCNHRTMNVPAPVLAFKVREEDDRPNMIFEDVAAKNYSVPKINERNKDFEFPALAPAPVQSKILDYSKIKDKKVKKKQEVYPVMQSGGGNLFTPSEKEIKEKKKKEKIQKEQSGKARSEIDKQVARLNNGHISLDEFICWIYEKSIAIDNQLITYIRKNVLSNSFQERIIHVLSSQRPPLKASSEEAKSKKPTQEEEKKSQKWSPQVQQPEEKKRQKPNMANENFPTLGPTQVKPQKTLVQNLLENIVILNNGLINAKYFVDCMLNFTPRGEIQNMKQVIRDKVRPESRMNEVLSCLDYSLVMTAYDNEYPSLSEQKPIIKKTFMENLQDSIKHLNTGMMTIKEFLLTCENISRDEAIESIKILRSGVYNSNTSSQIIKSLESKYNLVNYQDDFPSLKVINLPPEPKKKNNSKKVRK
ncbi:hypothetical protein SteCoe_10898 [Stentor coeruleus]|uniref:RING-type domain-containing protein n=1 Tax=Stentor coeruleus TaxID=5963 RepID=A0A1R2CEF5_9CILI|nr:hypothetical protein SteCoe_10898 [Stentor coeruleus]